MKKILCALILSSVLAGPLFAATDTSGVLYVCDVTKKTGGNWISDKTGVVVNTQGQAFVSDGAILHFNNAPVQASVGRNTDRILTVQWRLDNAKAGGQTITTFSYSARINKKSGKFSIIARPEGYINKFSGAGTCSVRNGKL